MVIAVVALAVLAFALVALLLRSQSRSTELTSDLDSARRDLTSTKDRLGSQIAQHEETISALQSTASESEARIAQLEHTEQTTQLELTEAKAAATEHQEAVTTVRAELAESMERAEELAAQNNALVDDRDALKNEIEAAKSAPSIVLGQEHTNGSNSSPMEALWDLELTRSERTWRHSVAINPEEDPNPFADTDDPVRLAVEIEAAALREDVGAFITIEWNAPPVADTGRRQLVLRVAQEILAAAAREPAPSTLRVSGEAELTLELIQTDEDDQIINLVPPVIDSSLVDVQSAQGLRITVRTD